MNSLPYCSGSVSQSSRSSLLSGRYFEMRLLQIAVTVGGSKKSRLILSASKVGESFRLSNDLGSLYSAHVRTLKQKKNHVFVVFVTKDLETIVFPLVMERTNVLNTKKIPLLCIILSVHFFMQALTKALKNPKENSGDILKLCLTCFRMLRL